MKKIIVPTDFSKAALNALDYAIDIAKPFNAKVVLLNVYSMPHSGSAVMIDVSDVLKKDSIDNLTKEKQRVFDKSGFKVEIISKLGNVASTISSVSADQMADLIIMGTTGASGLKEVFIGSNTATLIKETIIPILAIPVNYTNSIISNVAISVDLHRFNSSAVFNPLKDLLLKNNSTIKVINIAEDMKNIDPSNFVDEAINIDNMFFGLEHSFKFLEGQNVEEEILTYLDQENVDLLIVVSRKRNFFERLFHKSVSKKLTMHSPVPILVLSEK